MTVVVARGVKHPASRRDWEDGRDFYAVEAPLQWVGGPYFSVRDVPKLREIGVRVIRFVWIDMGKSPAMSQVFEVKL